MPRQHQRTFITINILLKWSTANRVACVRDISLGGCFIDCLTPIPHGEKVSFEVEVTANERVEFFGKVVYVFSGIGFGLQFTNLSDKARSYLEYLILMNNGNPWAAEEYATSS